MPTARRLPTLVLLASLAAASAAAAEPAAEPIAPPPAAAAALDSPPRELGYALGYRIGGRILADHRALGMEIDEAALARGITDAIAGARPELEAARFERVITAFEAAMRSRQEEFMKRMAAAADANLARGREYLQANAARPGVTTLPSGLQYEVLRDGDGPSPGPDDIVVAHYRGTHVDGREFDGTEPGGEPASFPMRGVVPGWQEALGRMKAGAKWRIHLPPNLAYGAEGSPPAIEPNEVLVFEIELLRSGPDSPDARRETNPPRP
jgi:FKBP-type peptidyl-prolyl cis-trans isomerase FklB